jgi:hypothetical protein
VLVVLGMAEFKLVMPNPLSADSDEMMVKSVAANDNPDSRKVRFLGGPQWVLVQGPGRPDAACTDPSTCVIPRRLCDEVTSWC